MKYVIVDDNDTDRMLIEALAMKHTELALSGSFMNPLDAIGFIRDSPPDLLFLDVEMPIMNGVDFLRSMKHPPLCIFITSHPDFAVEAFELFALDYIVKPLTKERFDASITRVKSFFDIRRKALQYEHHLEQDVIVIQEGYETHRVLLSDIIYLEALKDYTRIFTREKSYITLGNLSRTLEDFNVPQFMRVHRSYAVNAKHIRSIVDQNVKMDHKLIPIGKTYKQAINELRKNGFDLC